MERPVSFDVTDYNPSEDDWIIGLVPPPCDFQSGEADWITGLVPPRRDLMRRSSSYPIFQIPEMNNPEDETEYVEVTLDVNEDTVTVYSVTQVVEGGSSSVEQNPVPILQQPNSPEYLIVLNVIDRVILREFWEQVNDQNSESRLMTFFDMMDKDANGRLTEDEVREIISFSSSANNLSAIQKKTEEYAAMIMEELDPDNIGYISVESLKSLLLRAETQPLSMNSQETEKLSHMICENFKPTLDPIPLRRWYRRAFRSRTVKILKVCMPKQPPVGDMYLPRPSRYPNFPKIRIDGPYGTPAQDYKKYEVVLLIGLGIEATPMISIIKDIINNKEEGSEEDSQGKKQTFKTQRAYFYWVTREQGSFDWFKNIMNEIAKQDLNKVIELHNYCSSVYGERDVRAAFIHMLQSLNYAKNGDDIVSGTRVMTHFAKPNWEDVYKQVAMDHPRSHVGVFYCGSPILTKELRRLALEFTHKTNTRFSFHKENF